MKERSKLLLFIKKSDSTFVLNDESVLKEHYRVESFLYGNPKGLSKFLYIQIKLILWLLSKIREARYIYIWFADYHSFFPIFVAKIMKWKSLLVLGGYGVANIPDIKYGAYTNFLRRFCVRFSIENALICLPVSNYVNRQAKHIARHMKSKVLYNGIKIHSQGNDYDKKNIILTVGICNEIRRVKIKGIDFFIKLAKSFKNYQFIIVGLSKSLSKQLGTIPANCKIIEPIPHLELLDYYKTAKIYCQFSLTESFGLSVAEAMFYGCIPIVSDNGALPEIVKNTGYILTERNIEDAVQVIQEAINLDNNLHIKARKRALDNFSLKRRNSEIIKAIRNL